MSTAALRAPDRPKGTKRSRRGGSVANRSRGSEGSPEGAIAPRHADHHIATAPWHDSWQYRSARNTPALRAAASCRLAVLAGRLGTVRVVLQDKQGTVERAHDSDGSHGPILPSMTSDTGSPGYVREAARDASEAQPAFERFRGIVPAAVAPTCASQALILLQEQAPETLQTEDVLRQHHAYS